MFARFSLLVVGLLLALGVPARAWWNPEWTVRRAVTIDTASPAAGVAGPVGQATVLLRLSSGNFAFAAGKEDGSDIRVVAEDDKTLLPFHLERFDGFLNEGFLWVKVPEIKAGAKTTFWLYSGNTGEGATAAGDAKGSFDAETVLVYHFGEKGAPPADATGKGHTGSSALVPVTGSLIGGGARLDGRTPLTIPAGEGLDWAAGAGLTLSLWVKPATLAPGAVVLSRRAEGGGAGGLVLGLDNGTAFVEIDGRREGAGKPLEAGGWHHLAVVSEGGRTTLFVDGETGPVLPVSAPALAGPILLGGDSVAGATGFAGEVDELGLARVARTPGWVGLAARTQGSGEQKVIAYGADELGEGGGGGGEHSGYFKVIVDSLTFDGWVVIGILFVMLLVSWWVMITKVRYLNGLARGNRLFMAQWREVVHDLTVLDHGGDQEKTRSLGGRVDKAGQRRMRASSVYRIYHIGVEEIRHRLAADHSLRALSGRSIQSIRASLDGALVREKQTIDKLIVLLTICISGGPFLGLLGTVVGVMITFAAVAAAGDVNVNAIAPGIAAALLATVAGLAVAIPALFGYNYILARVKDATADMHVFIDEFITRMAEFYAEGGRPAPSPAPAPATPEYARERSGGAEPGLPVLAEASI